MRGEMKIIRKIVLFIFLSVVFFSSLLAQEYADWRMDFVRLDSLYYKAAVSSKPKEEMDALVRHDPFTADWLAYRVLDPNAEEEDPAEVFVRMYRHPQLLKLYTDTENHFDTQLLDSLSLKIEQAFFKLHLLDPQMSIPHYVAFHVSGFQQSIVTLPDWVSISIDKYIGPDYPLYKKFFSDYSRQTMSHDYIVRDAVLGWICSECPMPRDSVLTLRTQLEYWGRIYNLMSEIFSEASEEWLFGFTTDQLHWMKQNKKRLLKNAIERGEMDSSQPAVTDRYFKELPPDHLLPLEAPRLIGYWLGAHM